MNGERQLPNVLALLAIESAEEFHYRFELREKNGGIFMGECNSERIET